MWTSSNPSQRSANPPSTPYRPYENFDEEFRGSHPFPSPNSTPPPSNWAEDTRQRAAKTSRATEVWSPEAKSESTLSETKEDVGKSSKESPPSAQSMSHWMTVMNESAGTISEGSYTWIENKMPEDHSTEMQKGLEEHQQQQVNQHYGQRSGSSSSSSPPSSSNGGGMLVVPQLGKGHASAVGTSNGSAVFSSKADLQQLHDHMREAKPYKCSQCNKSFANSSYLSQHSRIHLGVKPYSCEYCSRTFTQRSQLHQHMKIHSGDKQHKCQYCGKDFLQLSHMRQHLRTHVGGKDFKCDHCPKAFRQKSHLLQHMRMHTGDKKYTCEICQRKFTQLSHLQQHIRTHTGDKPYKCRHHGCVKAFSQLSNLQSHSRCHQADKPYKCNACYKCFTDEAALLEHIPKHKESKHLKTHICQYCGKSYTQETYLQKHMQKHSDREAKNRANGSSSSSTAAAAAAAAAAAVAAGLSTAASDPYWSKVDPVYGGNHHDRPVEYNDPRLNPQLRTDSASSAASSTATMNPHGLDLNQQQQHLVTYDQVKTSSAFSPLQNEMLSTSVTATAGFSMPSGGRGYTFYDPLTFPKHHSQVGFDAKTGGANSFPNQLISLTQIRNYAHQPTSDHILQSLKEKAG